MPDINVYTWYNARKIEGVLPKHFVVTKTVLHPDAERWIEENLTGRYFILYKSVEDLFPQLVPAFEDPKEAVYYELTWS